MDDLVSYLIEAKVLKTPALIEAFSAIHRQDFLPQDMQGWAQINEALPIASGQTISQPYTVAFMLEQLQPQEGNTILDIGSGSGWTTALLAHAVSPKGKVIGIEVLPELVEFGKKNISKYNFNKESVIEIHKGNGKDGYKKEAPYDNILVSAALPKKEIPKAWNQQLKTGGRIVVPIQHSIWTFTKKDETTFTEKEFSGFSFVPFI